MSFLNKVIEKSVDAANTRNPEAPLLPVPSPAVMGSTCFASADSGLNAGFPVCDIFPPPPSSPAILPSISFSGYGNPATASPQSPRTVLDVGTAAATAMPLLSNPSPISEVQLSFSASSDSTGKLSDYIINRTLGTGSFGRVHLVQSKRDRKYYALKVLSKAAIVRLKQVEHVVNEKNVLSVCADCPFIVKLISTFKDDTNLYVVMEYVMGGELFSYLRKFQRFPSYIAKFYAGEVVLAFEYLHSKNIVYRDLKPENVLLDRGGHIKITDFGFAKYVTEVTWTLCGTPDYLAPEIIQSKGYGKAVDWYSLGILIFEMLAGYPPFYDEDHFKLYEKILAGKIRWPNYFDFIAKDLIKRLLSSDLSKRFGNLKGGSDDIKRHKWFIDLDWASLASRSLPPPIVPIIRGEGDTSNFDVYPEINCVYGLLTHDPYRELFADF